MIGDKIIIKPEHIKKAEIIFPMIINAYKNKKFILALAGCSGVGKSEVAYVIQDLLYNNCKIRSKCIHIDDYYKTNWHDRNKIRKKTKIIGKEEIQWNKLNKVMKDFRKNTRRLYVQRIHKYIDSIEYSICSARNIDILIVEGLYALYLKEFDYGVYLDGNPKDTYNFRLEREKEDPKDKFRKYVIEKEYNCVCQSKSLSDLIIPYKIK